MAGDDDVDGVEGSSASNDDRKRKGRNTNMGQAIIAFQAWLWRAIVFSLLDGGLLCSTELWCLCLRCSGSFGR